MIAYVKGTITYKSPAYVIVETGGIGYHINVSLNTYTLIEKQEQTKLLTYFHVKEDGQTLYGFAEPAERQLFVRLISVSGIGPNTAQVMLSSMNVEEIRNAIVGENEAAFKKVKGIGVKTAKRLILDLKDKLLKEGFEPSAINNPADNTIRQEALSALMALGIPRIQGQKALNKTLKSQTNINDVQTLIKAALKNLS